MEQFSANITDIKGEKEYGTKAVAKDDEGNVAEALWKTPYIGKLRIRKSVVKKVN